MDDVPEGIVAGSVEYWKFRARQWQRRCLRTEREQTRLIAELNEYKVANAQLRADRRTHVSAIGSGDVIPTARDYAPRPL